MSFYRVGLAVLTLAITQAGEEMIEGRKCVVLSSQSARVVIDLGGGAIREFTFGQGGDINPLSWNSPGPKDQSAHGFGHFLCLDRWGPPSEAEGARGMPYHGEASNVPWALESSEPSQAVMTARLPKAGLSVRRTVRISPNYTVFAVREEVTNDNALGRAFNIVQHPTIAPPFLDENTAVDCNGRSGFAQGGSLPNPEEPSAEWPRALKKTGEAVDLRHLTNDPDPNVVSFVIKDKYGWVTAANAVKGTLIGYVWRAEDYPWVSLWRDVRDGKPAARGLEFGSTGLHQPFPILTKKGRIWDRPLFEYIDAGQTITKRYIGFLLRIPTDFGTIQSVEMWGGSLHLHEKHGNSTQDFVISLRGLPDGI